MEMTKYACEYNNPSIMKLHIVGRGEISRAYLSGVIFPNSIYCRAKNNGRNSIFKVARRYRNVRLFDFILGVMVDMVDEVSRHVPK